MSIHSARKCCWILSDNTQCGRKVSYKIVLDDDENKKRRYEMFCQEHKAEVEKQNQEEDEQ